VDNNWLETMDIELVSGNDFMKDHVAGQEDKVLVSEILVSQLGLTNESIIGRKLYFDIPDGQRLEFEVRGVMNDLHQISLHKEMEGIMYQPDTANRYSNLVVHFELEQYASLRESINKLWLEQIPDVPFEAILLDEVLLEQYKKETTTFEMISFFAIISIIISCLGLYAMSVFITERKFKEIGIRKALGASVRDIVLMVSGGLIKLVIIAFVISVPLAWYGANEWLKTFAYHVSPAFWIFAGAGAVTLLVGWLAMAWEAFRAAGMDPVKALKDE